MPSHDSAMVAVDLGVVSNPLKQEILKLNEENYYLKLEVIRLVSTLKSHQRETKKPAPASGSRKRSLEPDATSLSSDSNNDNFTINTFSTTTTATAATTINDAGYGSSHIHDDEQVSTVSTTPSTLFSQAPNMDDVDCFSLINIPEPTAAKASKSDFFDFSNCVLTPPPSSSLDKNFLTASNNDLIATNFDNDFVFLDTNDVESAFMSFVS